MCQLDPQDIAERLDEDVVDDIDDTSGDEYGDGLANFPPDAASGAEQDDRVGRARRTPDRADSDPRTRVGQLVEPDASTLDAEEQLIGELLPGHGFSAEEAAMHVVDG